MENEQLHILFWCWPALLQCKGPQCIDWPSQMAGITEDLEDLQWSVNHIKHDTCWLIHVKNSWSPEMDKTSLYQDGAQFDHLLAPLASPSSAHTSKRRLAECAQKIFLTVLDFKMFLNFVRFLIYRCKFDNKEIKYHKLSSGDYEYYRWRFKKLN